MTGREEIEQPIRLAGPIYDDAGAIDAIESIIRKRAAAELRKAADWIWDDVPARASASAELHARADALDADQ